MSIFYVHLHRAQCIKGTSQPGENEPDHPHGHLA